MPRRQVVIRRVMTPRKKGDPRPLLWIVECRYAEVDVQPGRVEHTCLGPLVVSTVWMVSGGESGWRNNYASMDSILQDQAVAFQLKGKQV